MLSVRACSWRMLPLGTPIFTQLTGPSASTVHSRVTWIRRLPSSVLGVTSTE